jgi:hypothetical protein
MVSFGTEIVKIHDVKIQNKAAEMMVQMMAAGMASRGVLVSSAAVETMSNPQNPRKLRTFVTLTVTYPATRFASVVVSYSGPGMCEGSGLPFGHSKSVCCWAGNDVARPMQAATTQAAVYLFRLTAG